MRGYRRRFEEMVGELEAHTEVEVVESHFGNPAVVEDITRAKIQMGGNLPEAMEDLYREMDGFRLEWEGTKSTDAGRIHLLPIYSEEPGLSVLGDWQHKIWESTEDDFSHVKPFDFYSEQEWVALYPVPSQVARVHLHQSGNMLHPTGYDFASYIDRLLACRGMTGWQQTLCVDLDVGDPVRQFRSRLAELFADADRSLFAPATKQGRLTFEHEHYQVSF